MNLTLSADHRVYDGKAGGKQAATLFLNCEDFMILSDINQALK